MIKRCCAFLSALMIILFSTFSQYFAIPTYAAMDPRYYVAAGPLIASIFTAYGYKRSGTNSALADLVAQCVVDAADAGYTTVRNGVQSCGIAIEDGVSYCKKEFLDWVYSWCNQHNMSTPQIDGSFTYPSYSAGQSVQFQPYTGDWRTYAASCGFPANVMTEFEKYSSSLSSKNMYSAGYHRTEYTTNASTSYSEFFIGYSNIPAGNYSLNSFSRTEGDYSFSYLYPSGYQYSNRAYRVKVTDNGDITSGSSSAAVDSCVGSSYTFSVDGFLGPGVNGPYTSTYVNYSSTFNAVYTAGSAGYEVSDDAPSTTKTFTEYVSNPASWEGLNSWGGKEKNVNIDGTNTTGMPITIPIDIIINGQQIGAAVADIISGAQAAIDAALAMTQQVAREGTITEAVEGELAEANTAVDNTIEVADAQTIVSDIVGWGVDYVKPHLSNVFRKFPFSIPYDFYLLLKSMYGSGGNTRKLRSVRISNAPEDIFNLDPSSIPLVVDFDYVLPDQIGDPDPAAPKFMYDITVNYFGKSLHAEGSLDLAPFGGYFKLLKMGLAIIWIMDLLLFTQQQISNMKGGQ